MVGLHVLVGITVIGVSGVAAVWGLGFRGSGERFLALAGWALALMLMQLVLGFFIFTNTQIPGALHLLLPLLAVAALAGARAVKGGLQSVLVGAASLFATAVGIYAYVTGYRGT